MTTELQEWHHTFHCMGIPIHLTLLSLEKSTAKLSAKKVEEIFHAWDMRASRFKETSELMQIINHAGEWVKISPELFQVMKKSLELSKKNNGLFDISVGAYLAEAGYGLPKNYSLPKKVPNFKDIELDPETSQIKIAKDQVVEPAALVKAWAIDEAGQELQKNIPSWMINAGGDILTHGLYQNKKWRVGIQDPRSKENILGIIEISDAAIATSGTYVVNKEVHGKTWHHEINPKTGKPTQCILSLSVIAPSALQADIVSTLAFLHDTDAEEFLRKRTEPFLIVTSDLQILSGNGWQAYAAS